MYIAVTTQVSAKLGAGVITINRPVGDTCPRTCPLHPFADGPTAGRCYMLRIEKMRPAMRAAAQRNRWPHVGELAGALARAALEGRPVRLHPGGDFFDFLVGDLDAPYLEALLAALEACAEDSAMPAALAYTHCIDPRLPAALAPYAETFQLFASVHGAEDIATARACGFRRLALNLPERMSQWTSGAWVERHGERFLVCPEQRGKLPDCRSCMYCWRPDQGNVAFLEHSGPREEQMARDNRAKAAGQFSCSGLYLRHSRGPGDVCARCATAMKPNNARRNAARKAATSGG